MTSAAESPGELSDRKVFAGMNKCDVLSFHGGDWVRDALVQPVPGGSWVCGGRTPARCRDFTARAQLCCGGTCPRQGARWVPRVSPSLSVLLFHQLVDFK